MLGVESTIVQPWWVAAVASGVLLLLLDLHESAAMLLQVRGAVVLLKVVLLVSWPLLGSWQPWVLVFLVLISVVSSHAPGSWRYALVWGGSRVRGAETKG